MVYAKKEYKKNGVPYYTYYELQKFYNTYLWVKKFTDFDLKKDSTLERYTYTNILLNHRKQRGRNLIDSNMLRTVFYIRFYEEDLS